ncbi:MAG: hypothetical protein EXR73_13180 [Myxococcales bacterium]|nr:hypothetical protein [Myxococcales bacterium]
MPPTMPTPSKNAPCPCGSGVKYKKCCLPKDQTAAPPALPIGARLLRRDGESFVVSEGVTERMLDGPTRHFKEERRGRGPAQQMVDFAQPLIDAAGDDEAALNRAMTMGMVCWNLALCRDEGSREGLLTTAAGALPDDEQVRSDFREIASTMIARHRSMFPELHRAR